MRTLAVIGNQTVVQNDDLSITFTGQANVDGDGSPRCYGPLGSDSLDYLANAGSAGNWFGIATDSNGDPVVQGADDPYPGMYVSTTSLQIQDKPSGSPSRYVNSEVIPYIVIPGVLAKNCEGVVLGCYATITDTRSGKCIAAVVGDVGPNTKIGEISIQAATQLGFDNVSPKNGGVQERVFSYTVYANKGYPGFIPMSITGVFHPELAVTAIASVPVADAVSDPVADPGSGLQVNYEFQT